MASPRPEDLSEVKFLTVAEVAAVMRVSKMTVYRLVHGGELPAVRVGRSFRVPEDAVNEYLRKTLLPGRLTAQPIASAVAPAASVPAPASARRAAPRRSVAPA